MGNLGSIDWDKLLDTLVKGVNEVGSAVAANSNDPYYTGKYTLPTDEPVATTPATASFGSTTQILTIAAVGGLLLLGGYIVLKRSKK